MIEPFDVVHDKQKKRLQEMTYLKAKELEVEELREQNRSFYNEVVKIQTENRKLRERIKELEPAVSHVIARCSSCGSYTDDIEWHYKPTIEI
jgi:FtsZ-binding cell division protein ZapB